MKAKLSFFLVFLLVIALIISVAFNIAATRRIQDTSLLSYSDLSLDGLTLENVTEIYLSGNWQEPNYEGPVSSDEILPEVLSILESGCYLEIPDPKIDYTIPGSGAGPYIKFQTENAVYIIAIHGKYLLITISGESKWYDANITSQLLVYLNELAAAKLK